MSESASWDDEPLIPEQTVDDTGVGWGEQDDEDDGPARYLREQPPHHGD